MTFSVLDAGIAEMVCISGEEIAMGTDRAVFQVSVKKPVS
jgi:hypothetical protein